MPAWVRSDGVYVHFNAIVRNHHLCSPALRDDGVLSDFSQLNVVATGRCS